MTLLMVLALLVVIVPGAFVVYRVHARTHDLPRIPFGFGTIGPDDAGGTLRAARRYGPDADRIRAELVSLNLHHRDSA